MIDGDQADGLRKLLARESRRPATAAPLCAVRKARPGSARTDFASAHVVLVVTPDTPSILGAYAVMKEAKRARSAQSFALVVSGVTREQEAVRIHRNIADAAQRYLALDVELMGYLACEERPGRHRRSLEG